ncbi:MAG: hypothetical protein R2864_01585 [Syntrophotaleaceae bacterium]
MLIVMEKVALISGRAFRNRRPQAFGGQQGILLAGLHQQGGEFLAAETGKEVGFAHRVAFLGQVLEDYVAGVVAVGVVDLLEVVDVKKQQAQGEL